MAVKKINEATNSAKRTKTMDEIQKESVLKGVYYKKEDNVYTSDKYKAEDGKTTYTLNGKLDQESGKPKNFQIRDNGDIEIRKRYVRKRRHS